MKNRIIIALDFDDINQVERLVKQLDPNHCRLKVGMELYNSYGPQIITRLKDLGFEVFLDLKFYDIPNTVYRACKVCADLGVWMLNVHASGGSKMLEMAHLAVSEAKHKPLLIGVTVLTSFAKDDLIQTGITTDLDTQVLNLSKLCFDAKLDGVVCSAWEAKAIKQHTNNKFLTVTPGIRLTTGQIDDQIRIMTPTNAIKAGSDYLVIGRPITQAKDPKEVLESIIEDLKSNL